jgi:hypothetical protein
MGEQEHRGRQLKGGRPQGEDDDVLKSSCWPQQSRQPVVVPFSFLRSEFPPGGRYGAMAIGVGEIGQRIPPARPPALVALATPGAEPFLNDHLHPARAATMFHGALRPLTAYALLDIQPGRGGFSSAVVWVARLRVGCGRLQHLRRVNGRWS